MSVLIQKFRSQWVHRHFVALRCIGFVPTKALWWGLGSVLQWPFVLPRRLGSVLQWVVVLPRPCGGAEAIHCVGWLSYQGLVVGPMPCNSLVFCPTKALQWGLGNVVQWVFVYPGPALGPGQYIALGVRPTKALWKGLCNAF